MSLNVHPRDRILSLFPLAAFAGIVRARIELGEKEAREAYDAGRKDFGKALAEHLRGKVAEGSFPQIPNGGGHDIGVLAAWNAVSNGVFERESGYGRSYIDEVVSALDHTLLFGPAYTAEKALEAGAEFDQVVGAAYDGLVSTMIEGTLEDHSLSGRDHYCCVTDERYALRLSGWVPSLWRFDMPSRRHVEIAPIALQPLQHLEIEFKTGDVVVADWFRIDEFTAIAGKKDYTKPSVNSDVGRELETIRKAEEFGFVHVCVGNTSPTVLQQGDDVVIAWADEDEPPEGLEIKGSVCTDLWWVTMVEVARLAEIVAEGRECGIDEARDVVERYIAEHSAHVTRLSLTPGIKHLHFSGDCERFGKEFRSSELPLPAEVEPMFVLAGRELTLEDTRSAAPAP